MYSTYIKMLLYTYNVRAIISSSNKQVRKRIQVANAFVAERSERISPCACTFDARPQSGRLRCHDVGVLLYLLLNTNLKFT